jgi:hypothetical protein
MKNSLSTPIRSIRLIPVAKDEDNGGKLVPIKKSEKKIKNTTAASARKIY